MMLEARNIHKIYNNGKKPVDVLKGINLAVEKGAFIVIVGPSGAGKSTLLHILGGLDSPTEGRVILEEQDLYSLKDMEISRVRNEQIGFVFQFYHLLSEFTVRENVFMPALIAKGPKLKAKSLKANALELLREVGLTDRLAHFPNQLSGGEKQRVAIVRALINNPSLLLCDEPTGNLDSQTGSEIVALIKKINQDNKMSVVLVTHNSEVAKAADRVYHLQDGILVN